MDDFFPRGFFCLKCVYIIYVCMSLDISVICKLIWIIIYLCEGTLEVVKLTPNEDL